ncbi:hypothetical protein C5167_021830 [Papaver somniferum]|uniref:Uncharacterized protein n=1 Tax=Papaver somniferum TaxID=3469 RepID=A0A4Y7JK70_PAPSO|nr:hypothetical protein C5167_021830 [Papaver somniferum]
MKKRNVVCISFNVGHQKTRLTKERVPVKPLMRFKCVCKQWYSLIHTDRSFIDLHFTRSKACNFAAGDGSVSLFRCWYQLRVFSSAELLLSQGGVKTVEREISIPGSCLAHVFGAVNGLISVVEPSTCSIRVFNPSTGQSTPWIKSMIKQLNENPQEEILVIDKDGDYATHKVTYGRGPWDYFGYDPAAKEHKVITIWTKRVSNWRGFSPCGTVCEVMTVDGRQRNNNLLWRRLDDELSLPPTISPLYFSSSLYANGCIYWLTRATPDKEPLVVEFNVGSEKFRVISIPNYIIEEIRDPYDSRLIQIGGRLAVLAFKLRWDTNVSHPLSNNNTSMKMCVLYDDGDDVQHKKLTDISNATTSISSAGTVSNFYWIEETFIVPPFECKLLIYNSILAVPDTDLFIIKSEEGDDLSFYFYDWRKKSFSKDVQFILKDQKSHFREPLPFGAFIYKESLLPVPTREV